MISEKLREALRREDFQGRLHDDVEALLPQIVALENLHELVRVGILLCDKNGWTLERTYDPVFGHHVRFLHVKGTIGESSDKDSLSTALAAAIVEAKG